MKRVFIILLITIIIFVSSCDPMTRPDWKDPSVSQSDNSEKGPGSYDSKYCEKDSDCTDKDCCGCMNIDSICSAALPKNYNIDCTSQGIPCRCINNVCEEISYGEITSVDTCFDSSDPDFCILNYAFAVKNSSICNFIDKERIRQYCKSNCCNPY